MRLSNQPNVCSHTTVSGLYSECGEKQKTSADENALLMRGQHRMARLDKADRKVIVMQITTHYNIGMQKSNFELTLRQTPKWIGYSRRRPTSLKIRLIKCSLSILYYIIRGAIYP